MNTVAVIAKLMTEPRVNAVNKSKVANILVSVKGAGKWDPDNSSYGNGVFSCEAWGKNAEFIENYCIKGSSVAISGSLKYETWKDGETNREKVKISISSIQIISSDNLLEAKEESVATDDFDPF